MAVSTAEQPMVTRIDARSLPHPARRPGALRAAAVTLYGTLVLLGLAIPGSVVGALREKPPNPLVNAVLAVAEPIQSGLERLGIQSLYAGLKERFRAVSCGAPDSGNPC